MTERQWEPPHEGLAHPATLAPRGVQAMKLGRLNSLKRARR
jgi:hypothetical protein